MDLFCVDVNIGCLILPRKSKSDPNTFDDIYELFDKKTADIVATLTKDTRMIKKDREKAYCLQLKGGTWQAQVVKLGDILSNLEDLEFSSKSISQRKKTSKKIN